MDLTTNNTHTIDADIETPPPTQPTKTNTPKSLSFTTVTLKRSPHLHPPTTAAAAAATTTTTTMVAVSYKECLKNHAASIGGHAIDGCGEFMASSSTNPTDPRSLKCAACGCHRNFHRRDPPEPEPSTTTTTTNNTTHNNNNPTFLNCFYSPPPPPSAAATTAPPPPPPQPLPHRAMSQSTSPSLSSSPSHSPSPMSSPSSPPPLSHVPPSYHHHNHHHSSAPHMLLALGNAYSAVALPSSDHEHHQHIRNSYFNSSNNKNNSSMVVKGLENPMSGGNKKRYRTKFSQEQKEKMYSFSARLGWRMQKGDDGLVQEFCNDIGVPRGVFKVWMHNNKNTFKKRSSELVGNAPNQNNIIDEKINNNGDDDDDDEDDDDGNDGNNRGGGGSGGVGAGGFDSDINNPYNNTNGSNNSDIHRIEDGCVNIHVPINGLSS